MAHALLVWIYTAAVLLTGIATGYAWGRLDAQVAREGSDE